MISIDAHNMDEVAGRPSRLRYLDPRFYLALAAARREHVRMLILETRRRQGWFFENLTVRKLINMAVSGAQFLLKHERSYALPPVLKIDISPLCNLSCTICVHADPNGDPALEKQRFNPSHRMSVDQFRNIVDQVRGRTAAVSLYYVGDPLVHPDVDAMCSIARGAGLNVHISSNFSFSFDDARIRRLVRSGLTHLSVSVDGLSQAKYELTRVGGRIDVVLRNLRRLIQIRNEEGRVYPKVEVQYIKFQHNLDEVEPARRMLEAIGIDQFIDFWGNLGNYTERDPENLENFGPREPSRVPLCHWPHHSMVIKYNGDVIPCCSYRIGHQYSTTDDARAFGNVFQTGVADVWNNEKFRQARRMISDPAVALREPGLKEHFCYGCPALFETSEPGKMIFANYVTWDEHYSLGPDGRPIARRRSDRGWKAKSAG
jgi:MoaA/NifB/PqqE/SkfB family radical SAM enzyme